MFSGEDPITLLPFLATFRDVMNDHHKTEGAAVRILPYFLIDRASRAYHSHMSQKFNMGSKPKMVDLRPLRPIWRNEQELSSTHLRC